MVNNSPANFLGANSTAKAETSGKSDKVEIRSESNTFCDHCHKLERCTRVSTALGIRWFCAEAMVQRRARSTGTLSDEQLREIETRRQLAEAELESKRQRMERQILDGMELVEP